MPCGPVPPNPAELLDSRRMRILVEGLGKGFDVILFDTPPVMSVIDPVIVSNMVDATVLIVYPQRTKEDAFISAVEELKKGHTKIIGTIFNGMRMDKDNYYYSSYYKSYRSRGGYGEHTEETDKG